MQKTMTREMTLSFTCPKCTADITGIFTQKLSLTTGISVGGLENGELRFLRTYLLVGKHCLENMQIKFDKDLLTEKTTKEVVALVNNMMKPHLEEKEREKLEERVEFLQDSLTEKLEEYDKLSREKDQLQRYYEELKTKVISNPALKGSSAETDLLEDLEYRFSNQKFEDITSKSHGDILWKNIQFKTGDRCVDTKFSAVIDSKDKEKITESDIEKLRRDMKFHNEKIGLIITTKQTQLRMKEIPSKVYESEEGYVVVTSRENGYHYIAMLYVMDVIARLLNKGSDKRQNIDLNKLQTILIDILKLNEYFTKIKSNANTITKQVDLAESYLRDKLNEAWNTLNAGDDNSSSFISSKGDLI